ncbi:MAG: hypothetical protein IT427_07615 [Pirellulales bacterium]|nr:hypothetical protein [Pirellulales bacterium]
MTVKRCMFVAALLMLPFASGCGGGKSNDRGAGGGISIQQLYTQAMADNNPPTRARKLVRVGEQQFRAGDMSGADTSYREAAKAIDEIKDPYLRASAETVLAGAYARSSGQTDAERLLKSAAALVANAESADNKVELLSNIAGVYAVNLRQPGNASAKLQDAEKLAGDIVAPSDRLTALAAIIRGYAKAKKTADVDRLVETAGELADGIQDPAKKADALSAFGRALVDADRKKQGVSRLAAAAEAANKIDVTYGKVYALASIAEQYAHAGDAAKARALLSECEELSKNISEIDLRADAQEKVRQVAASLKKS